MPVIADYDYSKLRGRIAEKSETTESLSEKIGMSSNALRHKLKGRSFFTQKEIAVICDVLDIDYERIPRYFFTK